MSTRRKLGLGIGGVYVLGIIVIVASSAPRAPTTPPSSPHDEFKLLTWVNLPGPAGHQQGRALPASSRRR